MPEIRQLPQNVIDQIAAGEVVERPANLVKELIENSLDAGANTIKVTVKDSGRWVRVQDDGSGIPKEELMSALLPHATSKIQKSEDLWQLGTYGFRGEALASISAVSSLDLISRTKEQPSAFRVSSSFGQILPLSNSGGEVGTLIEVRDLFENVPARLKFLRSSGTEITQIKNLIKAMALSQPQKHFYFFNDLELQLHYPAVEDLQQRLAQVLEVSQAYGASLEKSGWQMQAAFLNPTEVFKTSKNIWIFCQNRWIQDRSIQTAVLESFRNLLMHGEFPGVVVHLKAPTDQVDVNIHPAKSQVKFLDPSFAFRMVASGLRNEIEKAPWMKGNRPEPANVKPEPFQNFQQFEMQSPGLSLTQLKKVALPEEVRLEKTFEDQNQDQSVLVVRTQGYWSGLEVIGQVLATYIVAQDREKLILIDQHAAHERINFEKLRRALLGEKVEIQNFLFPLTLDLTQEQMRGFDQEEEQLKKLGFQFEKLSPLTLGVIAAPNFLREAAISKALMTFFEEIQDRGGSFHLEKMLLDTLASFACHSSIRAGQVLSLSEMKELLGQMDENPHSEYCPHGRPVSVDWSKFEIEKEFGRLGSL